MDARLDGMEHWDEIAAGLARHLGLRDAWAVRERWAGATSTVVAWGGYAVKVPHDDPVAVEACLRHAEVAEAARSLGVAAPEILLVAHDVHPAVPVIVSPLLPGCSLVAGDANATVWRQAGEQLALLHAASAARVPAGLRSYGHPPGDDPRAVAEELLMADLIEPDVAARVMEARERLHARIPDGFRQAFCHGDMHAANVVADGDRLSGIVDWAGAGWLDPAWDFAAIPAAAVRDAVYGYRAGGGDAESLIPRIAWCRLQLALDRARRGEQSPADWARMWRGLAQLVK